MFLARRNLDARVLLTTFSDTLAHALRKLRRLICNESQLPERIDIHSLKLLGVDIRSKFLALGWGRTPCIAQRSGIPRRGRDGLRR